MISWRDSASQQAQADFDELLDATLPFARRQLGTRREFYPYAAAVNSDDQTEMIAAHPDPENEYPQSVDVIEFTIEVLTAKRNHIRAAAVVADVRLPEFGCDAIRVELEHAEGLAIVVLLPYTRKHPGEGVDYGEMRVQFGDRRLWPGSEVVTN